MKKILISVIILSIPIIILFMLWPKFPNPATLSDDGTCTEYGYVWWHIDGGKVIDVCRPRTANDGPNPVKMGLFGPYDNN